MFAAHLAAEHHGSVDPPRILVAVLDADNRAALVKALRDTGYQVVEAGDSGDYEASPDDYELVLADLARVRDGSVPTLLVPDPFDLDAIETLVLDWLGWDGPPTLRRLPAWALPS